MTFERRNPSWGHVRAETLLQRVHDDIRNSYQVFSEVLTGTGTFPRYFRTVFNDELEWRDSVDRQHYLEGEWRVLPGRRFFGNTRYAVNDQQGSRLADGSDQPPDHLGLLTVVARSQYVWEPNRQWQISAQTKGLVFRKTRKTLDVELVNEWTLIPMLKVQYRLTQRTDLWFGMEGLPGLPMRIDDRADGFNSVEERSTVLQMTNRSPYFGYQAAMNLGVRTRSRRFDDPLRASENWDTTTIFMNVILGFDE